MAISTHFAVFYTSTRVIMRNFALVKLCTIFYPNTMKKQLYCAFLFCIAALSAMPLSAQTSDGQSTEGKDFWVTLMRSDADSPTELSLRFSTKQSATIRIQNPYTGFDTTLVLGTNELGTLVLNRADCYVGTAEAEVVSQRAIHVTATENISLIAANYRDKSFDVAAILPTSSLKDEYRIQCYTPYDHSKKYQGSHFAIVATEDNTIVDFCPTVQTKSVYDASNKSTSGYNLSDEEKALLNFHIGDTLTTPVLKRGEVYYVWTGENYGSSADLSGTWVCARNNKPIAVFNGNPHTNIPTVRDRDHIYSQAMPVVYWGTQFAVTASMTRRRDKIRIQALNDGTEVRVNGNLVHTFDFASNPKHFYEFEIGSPASEIVDNKGSVVANDGSPVVEGTSCWIETSCPAAVHLFMVSNRYDYPIDPYCDGDPSMIWINPIEQQISDITFGTFQTAQVNNHYLNIVTSAMNAATVTLDGVSIANDFEALSGNSAYMFARKKIDNGTHQLKANSGFIAHVYGYGEKESYGYPAGGATKPLTQAITINGQVFTPDSHNLLCGEDTIHFGCNLNYEFEKIVWGFGDGQTATSMGPDSVAKMDHYYKESGVYEAYALIYRQSSNLCVGQNAVDSIPITVNIGRFTFSISSMDIPCKVEGQPFVGKIFFDNQSGVDLQGENTTIEYTDAALAAGFKNSELTTNETDNYFGIVIPDGAKAGEEYGIHLKIESDCGGTDTTLLFMLNYDNDVLTQRFTNVLGLKKDASFEGKTLTDFQWYRTSDSTAVAGQVSGVLHLEDVDATDSYYLCFYINKGTNSEVQTCTCAKAFNPNPQDYNKFEEGVEIIATTAPAGERIFVNAKEAATAQWINVNGDILGEVSLPAGGCTITVPAEAGFYILRVSTEKQVRNFKFLVTK